MSEEGYEKHARSTVKRLPARGKYDFTSIHELIDTCPVLHVAFPPGKDPFPVVLPMLGCTGSFETYGKAESNAEPYDQGPGAFPREEARTIERQDMPKSIYLHGAATARLFKSVAQTSIPVCVSATAIQGIVLALTAFHNSNNYSSAVVHGYATDVEDEAEKMYALTRITDNMVTGRWDRSRNPPTKAEMTSTGVIRVDIESASAKIRVGGPGDDRHDLQNEEVINNVWTGVVPCWTQYGEPIASDYNKVTKVPGYMREWLEATNAKNKKEALEAPYKPKQ